MVGWGRADLAAEHHTRTRCFVCLFFTGCTNLTVLASRACVGLDAMLNYQSISIMGQANCLKVRRACARAPWFLWICRAIGFRGWPAPQYIIMVTYYCKSGQLPRDRSSEASVLINRTLWRSDRSWHNGCATCISVGSSKSQVTTVVSFPDWVGAAVWRIKMIATYL